MFSYGNLWVMVSGILLGLSIIMSSVYFVNKMFVNDTKDVLVRFIILVFTSLVALFVVDKVIAFKIKLLADEINNMKDIVLKLQSYTMEVNKTLMEERINVFSDLGNITNLNTNGNELLSTNDLTSMDLRSMVQHELNELSNDN